jgi:hypothetical protein
VPGEPAFREWEDRLDAAERRLAQATSASIERSLAVLTVQLGVHIDEAVRQSAAGRVAAERGGVRQFVRAHTPLWSRRVLLRTAKATWWSLTLQLRRRLRERREWLAKSKEAREAALAASAAELAKEAREVALAASAAERSDVREVIRHRFRLAQPIRTYPSPRIPRSITVIAESLAPPGLLVGGGTVLLIGALVSARLDARLRIVTRTRRADAAQLADLLAENGLDTPRDIELLHAPPDSADAIPLGSDDAFLTTHWPATRAILAAARPGRVIQVVERDERRGYAMGDDRVLCSETLSDARLRLLIDGEPLLREMSGGPQPLPQLTARAVSFDPAFPASLFHDEHAADDVEPRSTLLLVAEPPGVGPLFWRTLEGVNRAIEDGFLARNEWRVVLVGRNLPLMELPSGVVPELLENLTLAAYASIVRQANLGIALTGSLRPSYPLRALLASGAVVVTDATTQRASGIGDRDSVVTSDLSIDGICRSIAAGVILARDHDARAGRSSHAGVARDWRASLETAISCCAEWIGA